MNWRTRLATAGVYIRTFPFKEALFMVVGSLPGESNYHGVIAYTDNEFLAYRIRREVIKDGSKDVKVVKYNLNAIKWNDNKIEDSFFSKSR
jgi:hypothetical protein